MQKKLKKLLPSLHLVSDWPRLILRFSIILIFSKFLFRFKEFDLQKISFSFSTLLGISIIYAFGNLTRRGLQSTNILHQELELPPIKSK